VLKKLVVGVALAGAVTLGFTLPAFADQTCYTACTPLPVGSVGQGPVGSVGQGPVGHGPATTPGVAASQSPSAPAPTRSVVSSGGLPFTGTDIEQSAGAAAVLLVAGAAMVRFSRRRARPIH